MEKDLQRTRSAHLLNSPDCTDTHDMLTVGEESMWWLEYDSQELKRPARSDVEPPNDPSPAQVSELPKPATRAHWPSTTCSSPPPFSSQ